MSGPANHHEGETKANQEYINMVCNCWFGSLPLSVSLRIAGKKLLDFLQRLVLRLGHARVQIEGADQCDSPIDDEQARQRYPRFRFQERLGQHERHEERQRCRHATDDATAPARQSVLLLPVAVRDIRVRECKV